MNVDVEIYINNIVKFFKSNPKDLLNLVPKEREEDFYGQIREVAIENSDKGKDAPLTQKQMIDICVVLNGKTPKEDKVVEEKLESYIMGTKFGPMFLN
jgi:hypothetical protein